MASSTSAPLASKTIILAFDGTSNKFGKHKTNLLRLYGLFDRANLDEQVQYYQPGVGTYLAEGTAWSPTIKAMRETLDSVFAWYLDIHILDGYRFLMKNYKSGDRVCMFGFSRGAYTARCLAGMLNKVGLLPPDNDQMVASAYERYLDTSPDGKELARDFKEQLGTHCPIEFLGLWDTVSSVGLVTSRHLPFSASNSAVKTVRHALALDERRTKFRHNPWYGTAREEGVEPPSFLREVVSIMVQPIPILSSLLPLPPRPEDIEAVDDHSQCHLTDVKEVWFAGCHSDVGGGHGDSDPSNTLSDPSLCWMINQILVSGVPVRFSIEALTRLQGFKPIAANPLPTPPKNDYQNGSTKPVSSALQRVEQRDVRLNAASCIHDELESNWFWWVPEYLPFRNSIFDRAGNVWREIR
ncbi:hypothetical protein FRC00_008945 [Tulasnella sp. 408]|nr:hypothetical protein FRC00_008945 [Tulasnella sp. 408]